MLGTLLAATTLLSAQPWHGGREGDALDPAIQPVARPYTWPDEPPEGMLHHRSEQIRGVRFTGRYANYTGADTWYLSWADDGHNYSPYTDGYLWSNGEFAEVDCPFCNPARTRLGHRVGARRLYHCHSNVPPFATGQARIEGDDPLNLQVVNLGKMAGGRDLYPCVGVIADGVWYIGTYEAFKPQGRFNGFRWSRSFDRWAEQLETPWENPAWTDTRTPETDFFSQDTEPRRFNVLHAVVYGQANRLSPDGKLYFSAHGASPGGYSDWDKGDAITLCRVDANPAAVADPTAYEFFAGRNGLVPRWSKNVREAAPILDAPKKLGSESITYLPGLRKYLLMSARLEENEQNLPYNLLTFWESDAVTGPYRLVHALRDWGPQTYFPHVPAKFVSPDGTRMWLVVSSNYSTSDQANPFGCRYALSMHEMELDLGRPTQVAEPEPARAPDRVLVANGQPASGNEELAPSATYRLEWDEPVEIGAIRLWDRPGLEDWVRAARIRLSDGSEHRLRAWLSNRALAPGEVKTGRRRVRWAEVRILESDGVRGLSRIEALAPQPVE